MAVRAVSVPSSATAPPGRGRAAEIGDRQLAEHVVEDRGRVLDRVVALHEARRLEAGEGEGLDVLLQRHAVLQAERDRDGEVVHHRAEGRAFLVHVDEDLAERPSSYSPVRR
jgi:hypothetical protein